MTGFSEKLDQLQRKIFDAPDADEPRLAYAKEIEPVTPDRAELIRLQVARIRDDVSAGRWWSQPSKRERELLRGHGADWAQLITPYARAPRHDPAEPGYEFNRGFVEQLITEAAIFAELGEELLRLGPIRHLQLHPDETPLATILAMPALRHLVSLELTSWKVDDAGAAAIAACPHLTRLASLGCFDNRIGAAGVEALAASPRTRDLVMVDLRANATRSALVGIDGVETDERGRQSFVPTELGRSLEAKYGHVRWLHPAETLGADRYHIAEVMRRRAA